MSAKIYPAKIDWWLWLILIGSSLGLFVWGLLSWQTNPAEALILIGVGIFDGILFGVILFPCYYAIEESHILIRSGLIRYRVPLDGVQSVTLSSNPLSAPAPSLRRVKIEMKDGKYHLVSPADREGFIREVKRLVETALKPEI
ncbi:MAG: PH domain-containing protein [Verrucomicrobiales bacterium]|nr:PH domain-containing protein [Verrucomicrobiales bacterium]